jgi:sporulation protein YlmC with PRC-barrel domain
MSRREINLEQIVGRHVFALNGHRIGRIEEVFAEMRGRNLVVREFRVGRYAILDRLSAWSIGRSMLSIAGRRIEYRIPWDKIDLSEPFKPRLNCPLEDIQNIAPEPGGS